MLLRPATPADVDQVARLHVRSWHAGYRGLLPDAYLDRLRPEEFAARYTFGSADPLEPSTTVSVLDSVICGFVTIGPAIAQTLGAGHLMALYIDPAYFRRGLGRHLLHEGCTQLTARGYEEAALWMLAGNQAAEQLYLREGWHIDGSPAVEEIWGQPMNVLCMRRAL